jgi:O-antigen/teichoic acid export membrane protein
MQRLSRASLRALSGSDTGRAAGLAAAVMTANVVALGFTLVFTRMLGQSRYGSLGALISTFIILMVPGSAVQTTVARELSAAIAAGDRTASAGLRRWLRRLALVVVAVTAVAVLARHQLAALIGVPHYPWAAAGTLPAGALWLLVSVERGALQAFQEYRIVGLSWVGEQSARLAFGLILVLAGTSVTGAFLGTPLALAIMALVLLVPLRDHLGGGSGERHRLRALFSRARWPIAALGLVAWLQDGNVVVVKHIASDHDAGTWAASAVAAKAIIWVAVGLSLYLVPEAARRANEGGEPRSVLVRTMALVAALAVPMVALYALAPQLILKVALHVKGGADALPLLGLGMSLLALTYLCTQYQLALHRVAFIGLLVAAAVAQPLVMLAAGTKLAPLALGLCGVQAVLAAAILAMALRARFRPLGEPAESDPPAALIEA